MKLPRKAITRAARSGRDISMRPQWLQKDKSRVGKQSEMAMRRAARRGLGDEGLVTLDGTKSRVAAG